MRSATSLKSLGDSLKTSPPLVWTYQVVTAHGVAFRVRLDALTRVTWTGLEVSSFEHIWRLDKEVVGTFFSHTY